MKQKIKKKKRITKPWGVLSPIGRYYCSNYGPIILGLIDFSCQRAGALTNAYGAHQIWAFRLPSVAMWHTWIVSVWWSSGKKLHRMTLGKILLKVRGTWDSNPGPRGYQYARLPLEPNARFEYIMTTNYYKRKVVSDAKITKSARWIQIPQSDNAT